MLSIWEDRVEAYITVIRIISSTVWAVVASMLSRGAARLCVGTPLGGFVLPLGREMSVFGYLES